MYEMGGPLRLLIARAARLLEQIQHLVQATFQEGLKPGARTLVQVPLELSNIANLISSRAEHDGHAMFDLAPLEQRVDVVDPLVLVPHQHVQSGILGFVARDDLLPRLNVSVVEELVGHDH